MADSERQTALQEVRAAKKAAGEARSEPALPPDQRTVLENLWIDLDSQEDILTLEAIDGRLDELRAAAGRLEVTAQKIAKHCEKLQKVAEVVGKAANALRILADIARGAGNLGVL